MPAWTINIDVTSPAGTDKVTLGAQQFRDLKTAIMERMNSLVVDFNADPLVWAVIPAYLNAGVPVSGIAGTGNGVCNPGCLLFDTTNLVLYININTKASPTWAPFILGDSV